MKRLQNLCRLSASDIVALSRRGPAQQQPQRILEQTTRQSILHFSAWTSKQGWTTHETADLLRLSPRTLRQWQADHRRGVLKSHALGRPALRSPVRLRNQVIELLDHLGPALGVPTLHECFPTMARAELEDLVKRYRRVWRRRNCQALRVLHWQEPGTVWAMDFAEAPAPIDGLYRCLLAVRDLASAQQLLWLPVTAPTAAQAVPALASLVALYGAPLVMKSDNGSAFGAEEVRAFLHQAGAKMLFSPPHWPRYNGAVEAGIGSLKTRTEGHASRHGHPGHWTWDAVEAARLEANATARPHRATGPTPDEAWRQRRNIMPAERALFHNAVARLEPEARTEQGHPSETELNVQEQRAVDRQAIRRALEECGYLLYQRRRIPSPIRLKKVTEI